MNRAMKIYTLPLFLFLVSVTSSFASVQKLSVQSKSRSGLKAVTTSSRSSMVTEKATLCPGMKSVVKTATPRSATVHRKWGVDNKFESEYYLRVQSKSSSGLQALTTSSRSSMVTEKAALCPGMKSVAKTATPRSATLHKKWGVDNKFESEYWFDARIHTLGNVGIMGGLHAASAAFLTKMIDVHAYEGVDVRQQVASELFKTVRKGKARVVDLCCGVGTSTRALCEAFPDAESVVGVDTSAEMIGMARFLTHHLSFFKPVLSKLNAKRLVGYTVLKEKGNTIKRATRSAVEYARGNAEDTKLPDKSFDLVTIMYAFHEAPMGGREKILREARRLLQAGGTLAVIDISTDFKPSYSMLMGEPYVLEYQRNIQSQLKNLKGFFRPEYKVLVPGHVGMWLMKRAP